MTSFMNNGEGTDGQVLTTTNSDGPSDDWSAVVREGTAVLEYDADKKMAGNTSIKCGSTELAERAHTRWGNFTPATTQKISARFYGYFPVGSSTFFSVQGASSIRVMGLALTSTGYLSVTDAPGVVTTSASPIEFSKWYRFEVQVDLTVPSLVVDVFDGHQPGAISSLSFNITPATAGGPIDRVVFGKYSQNFITEFWLDEIALVTDSIAPIGPLVGGGVVHYDIVGNYNNDSSVLASWTVDSRSSTGVTTLEHVSGPAVVISESPTGVFNVTNPATPGDITLRLTATSGGSTSQNIVLSRGSGGTVLTDKPYRWVYQGPGPASDIGNWS